VKIEGFADGVLRLLGLILGSRVGVCGVTAVPCS